MGGVVRFTRLTGSASGHEAAAVGGSGEPVECIPLAATLDGVETVDLLKVDTEGAEVDILEPAPTDLRDQVARVVVEYHDLAKRDRVSRPWRPAGTVARWSRPAAWSTTSVLSTGSEGDRSDVASQSTPPRWPPRNLGGGLGTPSTC